MATYLHREFERLIEATSELAKERSFGPKGWSMHDRDWRSTSSGEDPEGLFREFENHDVTPARLSRMHNVWASDKSGQSFETNIWYTFGEDVVLKVEGPNRIVVDGIAAAFERIAKNMESELLPNVPEVQSKLETTTPPQEATAGTVAEERKEGWLAKTWREHTLTAVIGLAVTVVGAGIAAFFGFN